MVFITSFIWNSSIADLLALFWTVCDALFLRYEVAAEATKKKENKSISLFSRPPRRKFEYNYSNYIETRLCFIQRFNDNNVEEKQEGDVVTYMVLFYLDVSR